MSEFRIIVKDGEKFSVDLRELHSGLESKQDFSTWVKKRLSLCVENKDFVTLHNIVGRAKRIDYHVTLEVAKSIAMMENTKRGQEVRTYFMRCEEELQRIGPDPTRQLIKHFDRGTQVGNSKRVNHELVNARGIDHREYHTVTQREISGKTPGEWKRHANDNYPRGPRGGKPRMSSREIIRKEDPPAAGGLSFCDEVTVKTGDVDKGIEAGKAAKKALSFLLS